MISSAWVLLTAQHDIIVIEQITLSGNKKTKDHIIYRELEVKTGDTIPVHLLSDILKRNETLLLNTKLFSQVGINIKEWDTAAGRAILAVELKELLYILPVPIFELADRNFSVWWNEQGRSLSRVDYGARLYLYNFTGRNDRLKAVAQFGFTRKWELSYRLPFLNKKQSIGIEPGVFYATQNTLGYITEGNKRLFENFNDDQLISRFRSGITLTYRPGIYLFQNLRLEYYNHNVDNRITEINPDFFLAGSENQRFFNAVYAVEYDRRDIRVFARSGHRWQGQITKQGFGVFNDIDLLEFSVGYSYYHQFSEKWSTAHNAKLKTEITRNKPPWFQNRGLGFGQDYLRGYELYIVDGMDFGYLKNAIHFKCFEKNINLGKAMPFRPMKQMPLSLYLSAHFDGGRVGESFYQTQTPFSNRWLYGYGGGIDLLIYNNYLLEFDVSVNHLGEVGLFFQYNLDF